MVATLQLILMALTLLALLAWSLWQIRTGRRLEANPSYDLLRGANAAAKEMYSAYHFVLAIEANNLPRTERFFQKAAEFWAAHIELRSLVLAIGDETLTGLMNQMEMGRPGVDSIQRQEAARTSLPLIAQRLGELMGER